MRIDVDSLNDPLLEPYRELKSAKAERRAGLFVTEGEKLAVRLLESPFDVHSVLVGPKYLERIEPLVPEAVPLLVAEESLVEQLVGFKFHRGVLACGHRQPGMPIAALTADTAQPLTLVICPEVHDAENLGSLLRIGAALGVDAVIVGPQCCDPFSRRVLRVSMGAVLRMPLVLSRDLPGDLQRLAGEGQVELFASVLDPAAEELSAVKRNRRVGLLLGSEGHGLSPELISLCQRRVTIPMQPGIDSLNVAVAAGILLYHFCRDATEPTRPH